MNNPIFDIVNNALVYKDTGEAVLTDEPVFILRGSDKKAPACLRGYQSTFRPTSEPWTILQSIIEQFLEWQENGNDDSGRLPEV